MSAKRKVQVFVAGCGVCDEAIELVSRIACPSCQVWCYSLLFCSFSTARSAHDQRN